MRATALVATLLVLLPAVVALADEPVATVGGHEISRSELEKHVRAQLIEIENKRYEALKKGLDELVSEQLLKQEAAAQKTTVEELFSANVTSKLKDPSDEEIQNVYDANKRQLGGAELDTVKPQIIQYLKGRQAAELTQNYIGELKKKHKTTIALEPPVIEVATGDRPSRGGGADAPVTIVAFSDYECPFCKRAEGIIEQVMSTYGDKVRYFHRDYPLPFHQHAHAAAEAARCANEQGKFWEYHTALFKSNGLSDDKFKELADQVGLDRKKFDECVSSHKYKDAVDADIEAGAEVGVNGTPAFFINGRLLSGAQPLEAFKEVIDSEIERKAD